MELSITAKKIKFILEYYDLAASTFADEISIQRPSVSHILSGRNQPSLDVIKKTLQIYSDINPMWLILEEETQMLLSNPIFKPNLDENIEESTEFIASPTLTEEKNDDSLNDIDNNINEKIKNQKPDVQLSEISSKNGKKIERIIVFYTDKTIDSYEAN